MSNRPSLTGAHPLEEIESVFAARDPLYRAWQPAKWKGSRMCRADFVRWMAGNTGVDTDHRLYRIETCRAGFPTTHVEIDPVRN